MHHIEGNVAAQTAGRVGACHEMPMCEPSGGGTPSFHVGLNHGCLMYLVVKEGSAVLDDSSKFVKLNGGRKLK